MKKRLAETDEWIESMGYYRKHVAHDETCLFRSVAEQIFNTQLRHEEIRQECVLYATENKHEFEDLVEDLDDYLIKLRNHMVICGNLEIQIISKRYKYDIILFDGLKFKCTNVTNNSYEKEILLCLVVDDHYDTLYKRQVIEDAGFCQSIVYSVLYENVYNLKDVNLIVNTMLYEKPTDQVFKFDETQCSLEQFTSGNSSDETNESESKGPILTPFPFKVAKALDPNLYRNIEFDTWSEFRKEWRLSTWYNGGENFKVGARCILKMDNDGNNETLHCYIQKLGENNSNIYKVYVEELAEYRDVRYNELEPMPDAKPWTLPYRYAKNMESKKELENLTNGNKKVSKKKLRKQKRKLWPEKQSSMDKNCNSPPPEIDANNNTSDFLGFPLNMPSLENHEEYMDPGSPPDLLDREIARWEPFQYDNQVYPTTIAPPQPLFLVPHKSVDPNGNDLPEDVNSLRYFFNLGIEYYCSGQMWSSNKPVYPAIQECSLGHTISSHYNMFTDPNNNMTYFSKQIKETSFGLAHGNHQNFCYQDQDYVKLDPSVPYGGPPLAPPTYLQCPPPTPVPMAPYPPPGPPPYHPSVMSPIPIIPDANRPIFTFPPPMRCDVQYNRVMN